MVTKTWYIPYTLIAVIYIFHICIICAAGVTEE